MVIKRKTIFLISLVILLVIVGYINHQLTKQSLLNSSNDYQSYEEYELANLDIQEDNNIVETSADNNLENSANIDDIDESQIVDSKDYEVSQLLNQTNDIIEETIVKEESLKSSNYFIEYRLSRDKLRASLIERLNEIINNEKTSDEIRKEAQQEIIRIGNTTELELYIESLIKAKGFEDALVFLKDDSARVVVSTDELMEQDVMKILEIIKNETNIDPSNIKIMKKF